MKGKKVDIDFSSRRLLQKTNEQLRFYYYDTSGRLVFVRFFGGNRRPQKTISKLSDLSNLPKCGGGNTCPAGSEGPEMGLIRTNELKISPSFCHTFYQIKREHCAIPSKIFFYVDRCQNAKH